MKRITPIILTAFSVFALSFSVSSFADNTDSDGFIVFEAETTEAAPQAVSTESAEQTQTASTESAVEVQEVVQAKPKAKKTKRARKAKNKLRKRAKRAKRSVRKTRTTRAQRSNLRRASSYRVRRGDTLYRISVKSGVKLNRLVRLNKLHGSRKHNIQAGQKIRLR